MLWGSKFIQKLTDLQQKVKYCCVVWKSVNEQSPKSGAFDQNVWESLNLKPRINPTLSNNS